MLGVTHGRRPQAQYPSWPEGALQMAGLFETGDGKFVNLHPGTPGTSIWANFCHGLGRADFLDEASYPRGSRERTARGREIERFVRDWFKAQSRDDIIAFADRPAGNERRAACGAEGGESDIALLATNKGGPCGPPFSKFCSGRLTWIR